MNFRLFSIFSLTVIYSVTLIPQETTAFKIILNIKPSCTNLDGSPCDDCENKVLLSLLNLYLSLPPAEEKAAASERDNVMKSILGGGGQAEHASHSETVERVVESKPVVEEFQTETHHQETMKHHVEGAPSGGGVETQAEQGVQQLFVEQAPSGGEHQALAPSGAENPAQAPPGGAETPAGAPAQAPPGDVPAGAPLDGGDDRPAD